MARYTLSLDNVSLKSNLTDKCRLPVLFGNGSLEEFRENRVSVCGELDESLFIPGQSLSEGLLCGCWLELEELPGLADVEVTGEHRGIKIK